METDDFFAANDNPKICLNGFTSIYDTSSKNWSNCNNSNNNKNCCAYEGLGSRDVNEIKSLDDYEDFIKKITKGNTGVTNSSGNYPNGYNSLSKKLLYKIGTNCTPPGEDPSVELKNLIGLVDSVDVNHRLLKKQYNELIFSPNEVINVDENINKFRYLELDRKLEKYDKKTYSLYKIFFYIMLITSGTLFIRKQLKK